MKKIFMVMLIFITGVLSAGKYPDDIRKNFIEACVTGGGTRTGCICVLEEFESKLSREEFERFEIRMMLNTLTEADARLFEDVVLKCRGKK